MKHKATKQILSILLAMIMLVGMLPTTALAEDKINQVSLTLDVPVIGQTLDFTPTAHEGIYEITSVRWLKDWGEHGNICVGVLEQFPNMVKLRLPKSVTRIDMTDELNTLLNTNDVLVHAAYGSYGDTVAQNNGLRFLPENIELAWCRDEEHDESTKLVLRFYEDGSMDILYDIFTAGISAGSNGGASLDRPMPEEYYPGCTLEEFADMFSARYHEQIINNSELKIFLRREAERKKRTKNLHTT